MAKQAIMKLFNVIMLRAGITLIITVAFSISAMLYSLTATYPFFLIAFLQIVTFAGIYMKLGDIMSMFRLQSSDTQQVGRRVMHRPNQILHRTSRRLQRSIGRTLTGATAGATVGAMMKKNQEKQKVPSLLVDPYNRLHRQPKRRMSVQTVVQVLLVKKNRPDNGKGTRHQKSDAWQHPTS